jgi:hypothetical protein
MPAPQKPATTPSLPGALSTRTDGPGSIASKQAQRYISGMPNYGDGQDMINLQAQAPMSATRLGGNAPAPSALTAAAQQGAQQQQGGMAQQVTPLSAPTQRPDEPVTTGSPMGAGAGPEAIGIQPGGMTQGGQSAKNLVQALAANKDASPELQALATTLGK